MFSFSQAVWEDMLHGFIVTQDETYYYVFTFDNLSALPKPTQQRSVLIKDFKANITSVACIEKSNWTSASGATYSLIYHFLKNKNNHTKSSWNYIGVRVAPEI